VKSWWGNLFKLAGRDGNKLAWGPPRDIDAAITLLRDAVASGVNHIDTAGCYGPRVNEPDHTKDAVPVSRRSSDRHRVSARGGEDGSWIPDFSSEELTAVIHHNLRNLGLDVLDVVNLRSMFSIHEPAVGKSGSASAAIAWVQFFRSI
jgi:aryl-alcohol dehydrogenase-like predicted oxidoreductase